MIIEDNAHKTLHFSSTVIGKVFRYGNDYFLRINKTVAIDEVEGYINAVNLETGKRACFKANDVVELIENAKVVIE